MKKMLNCRDDKQADFEAISTTPKRDVYSSPKLVVYGSVTNLTATGSGVTVETDPPCKQGSAGQNNPPICLTRRL